MDNEYFEALRRTGKAWDAYSDAVMEGRGEGKGAENARCQALWVEFQASVVKLTSLRDRRA
jgi:hypothetical protein